MNTNESPNNVIVREEEVKTKEEAEHYIRMYLQECAQMQNNDHEFSDIQTILDNMNADKIPPREAVEQAKAIRYSKMEKIG